MSVYLDMYSTEICIAAALVLGFGIGAMIFYGHGKDKGYEDGFSWARELFTPRRDRKGRFTCN